jgi:hypothetical protein
MSAVTVMLFAWGCLILAHWANSEPTISTGQVVEMTIALVLIAVLEGIPSAEPLAKGFAWIFLAATLLSSKSIISAIGTGKIAGTKTGKAA